MSLVGRDLMIFKLFPYPLSVSSVYEETTGSMDGYTINIPPVAQASVIRNPVIFEKAVSVVWICVDGGLGRDIKITLQGNGVVVNPIGLTITEKYVTPSIERHDNGDKTVCTIRIGKEPLDYLQLNIPSSVDRIVSMQF